MAKLLLKDGKIALVSRYEDRETAKSVTGRDWDPIHKLWMYPLRPETLQELTAKFPGIVIDPAVGKAIADVEMREALATRIKLTGWEDARATEAMPVKLKPFAHQVLGYEIACKLLGILKAGDAQ